MKTFNSLAGHIPATVLQATTLISQKIEIMISRAFPWGSSSTLAEDLLKIRGSSEQDSLEREMSFPFENSFPTVSTAIVKESRAPADCLGRLEKLNSPFWYDESAR